MSSQREPMWFCHECHAEMRPLMIPDPHCASCRGTFVEMMDDPSDDPRHEGLPLSFLDGQNNLRPQGGGDERPVGGMPSILEALSNMFANPPGHDHTAPNGDQFGGGTRDAPREFGRGGGIRVVINTPSGIRSARFGGSNTLGSDGIGRSGDRPGGAPLLSEFLSSNGSSPNLDPNQPQQARRAPAPLLASYLLSNLLGGGTPGRDGHGMMDPFEMLMGGRFGDYVVNEQALQNIMNELMANGGAQPTDPPASEEVIENLPRVVLEEGHPLASDSCSICHEPFNPALAASPDAFSSSPSPESKDEPPSLVGVTLPCDHTFHEDCILPWMRMKSTCPVCRKSVLPASQTADQNQGPRSPHSPSAMRRRSSGSGEGGSRIPGAWDALD